MRHLGAAALAVCLMAAAAHAQRPEFEVATVKLSPPVPLGRPIGINLGTFRSGTLTLTNAALSECVEFASPSCLLPGLVLVRVFCRRLARS